MSYVDKCRNMFGPLDPECRARLKAVINNPTNETWADAYTLIVGADGSTTLWQAWIRVDPNAPKLGPPIGSIDWPRIPDQLTLYRALREVTSVDTL